jgi:hypothetical protein
VIAVLVLAACRIQDPFPCTLDEHCGSSGVCEAVGYCSFPDEACPYERRYDDLAGDDLGGQCVDLGCSAGYVATIPGSRSLYRVVDQPVPWLDAQNDCANDGTGTHLVVIGSEPERSGVVGLIQDGVWIGFSDRAGEGTFRWVTRAASTFTAWANGQPDDSNGNEDCTEQKRTMGATWSDQPCTELLAYVCECDGVASDPTAF